MKKASLSILLLVFFLTSGAQTVLTISDEDISLQEFKNIFYKNNHNEEITKEYLDEYMRLFVNFKLKVKEAEELGFDTVSSFVTELEGYRKQLAKPYLKDKEFADIMLSESYERMKKDVHASHILISIDDNMSDKDENKAYKKALNIRESILSGEVSFMQAAKNNSDDKSAVSNGGDLGYFTAFMMVYDFETAAYETNVGEISMPVRTKYGYHIIKVNNRRDAVGTVKVSHIMFKTGKGADKKRLDEARDKIYKAMKLIKDGVEFSDVAERFSEDRSTAVKGGSLPAFGVGKMVPEFESTAFSLKSIGDISIPFKTEYGWHIIKLLEKTPIADFSDIESDLRRMIEKDSRGELSQKALYDKLQNTYKIVNKPSIYSAFRKKAALKVSSGTFKVSSKDNAILLTIDGSIVTINTFSDYILRNQLVGSDIDAMYVEFVNEQLLLYEEKNLGKKYPEYQALLNEYREGILLFDLTNKKVWSKAIEDTVSLQEYFNNNRHNYVWEERVDATVYTCIDLTTARKVKRHIYKKKRGNSNDLDLLSVVNNESPLSLQINSAKFLKGDNEHIDSVDWKKGISRDIRTKDGSYIIIDIHELLPAGEKKLDETRGKVISDYQNILEKEWIALLQERYRITINKEVLYSLLR